MSLTAAQYRASLDTLNDLVQKGVPPARARLLVRRALERVEKTGCCGGCRGGGPCGGGMGVQQTRSLRRDLDPSIAPRPVQAGEQCVRLVETPGDETPFLQALTDYRNRGWTVTEILPTQGFPSTQVVWACPPGKLPMESQVQFLQTPGMGASVLDSVSAAGDDPMVAAARGVVSKWSWLIPVGGLLMSAKRKISELRTPATAAVIGRSRRRR